MKKFHLVSLGCAKNLVDSELILGALLSAHWQHTDNPDHAQVIILNTCGFIQPAVEEAIEEILDLATYKENDPEKKLVVIGCLVQRYKEGLLEEFPEVDLFVGTEAIHQFPKILSQLLEGTAPPILLPDRVLMDSTMPRTLTTPFFRAWLKITEGCDNRCSYCMIPSIRGDLRSRQVEDLVHEAKLLEQHGVRELSLIAQDLTAYGDDLGNDVTLIALLKRLLAETDIPWIRLLYLYPSGITDELIDIISQNPRIVKYLDIPFQHVSGKVLKRMNRHYTTSDLYGLIERLRTRIPELSIRTTFLLGFPGETQENVQEVEDFIKQAQFDHLGVFAYANEEGCPSEKYEGQVSEEEKDLRVDWILSVQSEISQKKLTRFVGRREQVLVEGVSKETDLLLEGRTQFQAPEIDGCVYISEGDVNQGDIVEVEITEAQIYDLVGKVVD